ncbi:hypothetical protein ACFJGV_15145 [Cnuibacter sp. UC19_7]|uniref:hypothetical protein n=1 Tax=Cnuibacter sp. UC19_7 TaxID=3350166 RepID=UPI00366F2D43
MSLLDQPPHTVTVQNRVRTRGAHGETLTPSGAPVPAYGSLQPLSATESALFDGTVALTQKRFICRDWPGNADSEVTAADGVYDCVGDPQHRTMSPRTAHWEITLKRRADS